MRIIQFTQILTIAPLLAALLGCASESWNLDQYRDERAMDIEDRLTRDEPIVKSPFSKADSN